MEMQHNTHQSAPFWLSNRHPQAHDAHHHHRQNQPWPSRLCGSATSSAKRLQSPNAIIGTVRCATHSFCVCALSIMSILLNFKTELSRYTVVAPCSLFAVSITNPSSVPTLSLLHIAMYPRSVVWCVAKQLLLLLLWLHLGRTGAQVQKVASVAICACVRWAAGERWNFRRSFPRQTLCVSFRALHICNPIAECTCAF